jgi:pimeloyl-ACP methyl ester carboxylesterase
VTRHRRRRAPGWIAAPAAVVLGAEAMVTAGAVAGARQRRSRHGGDPCGPAGFALPDSEVGVVRTEDGADLAVLVAGPADGPTVVLAHCWTGTKETWAAVARRLVRLGHRVVLYDQRGHGRSGFGAGLSTIETLGDDLSVVLAHVDARHAVVVGHSMGGMAVQAYVARLRHHADRVAAVVLVATASRILGRALPGVLAERVVGDTSPSWTRRGRRGAFLARQALGRSAVPSHVAFVRDTLDATAGPVRVSCLQAMARMDLRPGLAGTAVPATILVGTRDLLTPPRLARALWRAWPGSALRTVPGAGHMLPLEAPDEVVDAIARATAAPAATAPAPTATAATHDTQPRVT